MRYGRGDPLIDRLAKQAGGLAWSERRRTLGTAAVIAVPLTAGRVRWPRPILPRLAHLLSAVGRTHRRAAKQVAGPAGLA